jgi:hypothetical protein
VVFDLVVCGGEGDSGDLQLVMAGGGGTEAVVVL